MLQKAEGASFSVEFADTLMGALDSLARRPVDAVLLGLFLPDSRGLETLATVRAQAPGIPVLVWTHLDSRQLAQEAIQAGAEDYLIKDRLNGPALSRALLYALMRRKSRTPMAAAAPQSAAIGILGAKGGVGATTVACHLGVELRRVTQARVLLADLDWNGGEVAFLMKAESPYSILDAAGNLNRLDAEYWNGLAVDAHDVSVIRSPGFGEVTEPPPVHRLRHVFRFLRSQYSWLVADLGRMGAALLPLVEDLDELLLVTTCDVQSLYETRRIVAKLSAAGFPADKVRLVLNRQNQRGAISAVEVRKLVGIPVFASLPNNYAALAQAYTEGQLLGPGTNLGQGMAALAARVARIPEAPAKSAGSLLRFLMGEKCPASDPRVPAAVTLGGGGS